jgi:hypothetical protein
MYDVLADRFGRDSVVLDIVNVEPGINFLAHVQAGVGSCDVMLAIIGHNWVSATDYRGRRRLEDPDDLLGERSTPRRLS